MDGTLITQIIGVIGIGIAVFKGYKHMLDHSEKMVAAMEARTDKMIASLNLKMDAMEQRITARIDRLESRFNELEKDVSMIKGMLSIKNKAKAEK